MREYWLDPPEYKEVECPVCKCGCEELFFDINNDIVGCDCCISSRSAAEYEQEQEDLARDYADEMRFEAMREARFERD